MVGVADLQTISAIQRFGQYDAGETVRFDSSAAVFSAILTAGTGELLITRVDL